MQEFIAKHRDEITGVLSGFDRLVFRGTLRSLSHVNGMDTYLAMNKVLRKDFGRHVQQVSEQLKQASRAEAIKLGRPVKYLTSPQADKGSLGAEDRHPGERSPGVDLRPDLGGALPEF